MFSIAYGGPIMMPLVSETTIVEIQDRNENKAWKFEINMTNMILIMMASCWLCKDVTAGKMRIFDKTLMYVHPECVQRAAQGRFSVPRGPLGPSD